MFLKEHATYIFMVEASFRQSLNYSFAAFHITGHQCMLRIYIY